MLMHFKKQTYMLNFLQWTTL